MEIQPDLLKKIQAEGGNDGLQASQPFDLDGIIIQVSGQIIKRRLVLFGRDGRLALLPGVSHLSHAGGK